MEPSTRNPLHRSNTVFPTSISSHVISKFNAAPYGIKTAPTIQNPKLVTPTIQNPNFVAPTIQNPKMVAPTIRIVHIFPPKIIKTDPANFRALVQKLTGRNSPKKPKKMKKKLRNHVTKPPPTEDHSFCSISKQAECPFNQNPFAEIKSECFGGDGMNMCDNFGGYFGGFTELDAFGSMLPEFPTIGPQLTDHRSGIFMPLESGEGFSHFS